MEYPWNLQKRDNFRKNCRGEISIRDNLIAIEMKKAGRAPAETEQDHIWLKAMTKATYDDVWSFDGTTAPDHVCGYELGVFILLDPANERYKIDFFQGGKAVSAEEAAI